VWEGLNFVFPETPRGEVLIFRGVELSEAALESYRKSVGHLFAWPMFTSFTEKREEAEEYGRAWRGGVRVLFELRSAWCRRLRNGTYLLHPFAVLEVEAVSGNAVKLVEVELVAPAHVEPPPAQRPGVVPKAGDLTEAHQAARAGDVRAIARFAAQPEFINARDADGWTPLAVAAHLGHSEAVKELAWLGADLNFAISDGSTPVYLAARTGHVEVVKALGTLGASVNVPQKDGMTPVFVAACKGHVEVVTALGTLGANVSVPEKGGATPICVAAQNGHVEVVKALGTLGVNVSVPAKDGRTPVYVAAGNGHVEVVRALGTLGAN
jgi:predicted LPLAT superfamily acyltransferase